MKNTKLLSLALLASVAACSGAEEKTTAFKADVNVRPLHQDAEPEIGSDAKADTLPPEAPPAPVIQAAPEVKAEILQNLEVRTPMNVIRTGAKTLQAEAILAVPVDSRIIWSLEGPANVDLGQIDENGKYISPAKAAGNVIVTIVATLESDPAIVGRKPIEVVPAEQIFQGCVKGSVNFPITADVYQLPPQTPKLPDFSKMTKSDVVCLDKFDIPTQNWASGFPGASQLQEWFGLQSKAKIIIPKTGSYEFKLFSDDGAILYIDGKTVVNNDGTHSPMAKNGSVSLNLGKHDLVLDYFQGPRTQVALQLFWKVPGAADFVLVPASAFAEK